MSCKSSSNLHTDRKEKLLKIKGPYKCTGAISEFWSGGCQMASTASQKSLYTFQFKNKTTFKKKNLYRIYHYHLGSEPHSIASFYYLFLGKPVPLLLLECDLCGHGALPQFQDGITSCTPSWIRNRANSSYRP